MENIEIKNCKKLQKITLPTTFISLILHGCRVLQRISRTGDLINLTNLRISCCPELEELPSLSKVSCMEKIQIDNCQKLQNIKLPPTLMTLSIDKCRNLRRIVGFSELVKLIELIVSKCAELEELPSLSRVSCMQKIKIDFCEKLQNIMLPTTIISLCIQCCRDLKRVVGYGDLMNLTEMIINVCPEVEELPSVSRLSHMEKIVIASGKKKQKISGLEELHTLGSMQLGHWSNAAILNCIQNLKSAPRELYMIGKAVDGADSIFNENLFSDAYIGTGAVTQIVTHSSGALGDTTESSFNENIFYDGHIGAYALTEIVTHNSGAVDIKNGGKHKEWGVQLLLDAFWLWLMALIPRRLQMTIFSAIRRRLNHVIYVNIIHIFGLRSRKENKSLQ